MIKLSSHFNYQEGMESREEVENTQLNRIQWIYSPHILIFLIDFRELLHKKWKLLNMDRYLSDMKGVSNFINSQEMVNYFNSNLKPHDGISRPLTIDDIKAHKKINEHFKKFFRARGKPNIND